VVIDGIGIGQLVKQLTRDKVKPIVGKATIWHKSYLMKILHNRAVLGASKARSCGRREMVRSILKVTAPPSLEAGPSHSKKSVGQRD
jgi:hypothetical protein